MLIASGGVWLRRGFDVPPKAVSTMMFYLLSPALVFYSLYTSQVDGAEFISLFMATFAFQIAIAVVAYGVLWLHGADVLESVSVMLSTFCPNAGNFGLSLAFFAFGDEVLSRAVIVFVANGVVVYSFGVYVASYGRSSPKQALMTVFKTPTIYAVLLAFVCIGLNIHLPLAVDRAVSRLADAAIPVMLLLLGLQLGQLARISKPILLTIGVGIKLLFAPILALGLALVFHLAPLSATAFILQMSMPTAVLTIVFATEFDLDRDLSLNLIMFSTMLSPITLSVLILILQETYIQANETGCLLFGSVCF